MKRLVLITIIWSGFLSVCSAQQLSSAKDSVAYAVGTDIASMVKRFDSTLDITIVARALQDAYADKSTMSTEVAMDCINRFVQAKQQAEFDAEFGAIEIESKKFLDEIATQPDVMKSPNGLLYKIENMGGDKLPQEGDMVTVHYTLTLPGGEVMDSSIERGEPFTYSNIKGATIEGFREGVQLLGEGGKATLYLPASLGYGTRGSGMIKPNQALIFEIKLLAITPKK